MYCTRCGSEYKEGSKFCPSCGAPIASAPFAAEPSGQPAGGPQAGTAAPASGSAPAPAAGSGFVSAPAPTPGYAPAPAPVPPKKRHTGRIVAIVLAVIAVVIAVVVAVFLLGGTAGAKDITAAYGSTEAIAVSRTARIVPRAADGTPIEHYVVRLVRATDDEGSRIEVDDIPAIDVTGVEGFAMRDILPSDAPDGTYYPVIEPDGGDKQTLPPVTVDDENPDDTVYIDPNPTATSDKAAQLFLAKIQELQDVYGEARIKTVDGGFGSWTAYISGLAYAELVDFGDGAQRLVVAYIDDAGARVMMNGIGYGVYTVEIWEYDEESGELMQLFRGISNGAANGAGSGVVGLSYLEYARNPETGNLVLCTRGYTDSFGGETLDFYGVTEDGFGVVNAMVVDVVENDNGPTGEIHYFTGGEQVDEEAYRAALTDWRSCDALLLANASDSEEGALEGLSRYYSNDAVDEDDVTCVEDAVDIVRNTIDLLEARVNAAAAAEATSDGAASGSGAIGLALNDGGAR